MSSRGSSDFSSTVTVADVYDMAAVIGKEFEQIIDSHGPEHITNLMQKVIETLEHLEQLACEKEQEKTTIDDLASRIKLLELEEMKRTEENKRNNLELEQIEDHYKQETRDLLSTIKRLQDENRRLSTSLAAATEQDSAFSEDESYFEVDLVNRLQAIVEKQRNQIKKLDQSVLDLKTENEELVCQSDKVTSCNRDLRRKFRTSQSQIHLLIDERADLTAKLQDQHREVLHLTRKLGTAAKENEDLSRTSTVIDDPDRPRFSLSELRDILQERNSLKAKVSDLEDELAIFRPKPRHYIPTSTCLSPTRVLAGLTPGCDCEYHSGEGCEEATEKLSSDETPFNAAEDEDDEDLPVQGPLPQDPDDAPFRRNESGIRKFFRRVFGNDSVSEADVEPSSGSPHTFRKSFSRLSFLLANSSEN